jgi:septal ring factor EnvC (AmiA/AmiB activator)
MTSPLVVVDRESITNSFRIWHEEQQQLDSQLAESVAALDAFQATLETWQLELVQERDELRQLRETLECEKTHTEIVPAVGESGELAQLRQELQQAREQISALTADLALARAHELELGEALVAEQHAHDTHVYHQDEAFDEAVELVAAGSYRGDTTPTGNKRSEPRRGSSPVLGSVMEQFGKLREQRSLSRSNTKPRL